MKWSGPEMRTALITCVSEEGSHLQALSVLAEITGLSASPHSPLPTPAQAFNEETADQRGQMISVRTSKEQNWTTNLCLLTVMFCDPNIQKTRSLFTDADDSNR